MLASVLGMALSIEFGIADTYALGVGFYVIRTLMLVVCRRAARTSEDDATSEAIAVVPSIQPRQSELLANVPTRKPSTVSTRADEVAE